MTHNSVSAQLVAEPDLTAALRRDIRTLLTGAFPDYADLWIEKDSWGGPMDYRLLLCTPDGHLAGHLAFGIRHIDVAEQSIKVAGIGLVAIFPEKQGQGLGRQLLQALEQQLKQELKVQFGFLQCLDVVTGFYEKAGYRRIYQPVRSFDPDDQQWKVDDAATMIRPCVSKIDSWPRDGLIDLKGMPW